MAKPTMGALLSVRLPSAVMERLEDCADAEQRELADLVRNILDRASTYRLNKLRDKGLAPPARPYLKQ